jgi:hypothetical protein
LKPKYPIDANAIYEELGSAFETSAMYLKLHETSFLESTALIKKWYEHDFLKKFMKNLCDTISNNKMTKIQKPYATGTEVEVSYTVKCVVAIYMKKDMIDHYKIKLNKFILEVFSNNYWDELNTIFKKLNIIINNIECRFNDELSSFELTFNVIVKANVYPLDYNTELSVNIDINNLN